MGSGNFLVLLGIFGTFLSRWARRGNFSKLGINSVWGLGILIFAFLLSTGNAHVGAE